MEQTRQSMSWYHRLYNSPLTQSLLVEENDYHFCLEPVVPFLRILHIFPIDSFQRPALRLLQPAQRSFPRIVRSPHLRKRLRQVVGQDGLCGQLSYDPLQSSYRIREGRRLHRYCLPCILRFREPVQDSPVRHMGNSDRSACLSLFVGAACGDGKRLTTVHNARSRSTPVRALGP